MKSMLGILGFLVLLASSSTNCWAEQSLSDLCVEHFDAVGNASIEHACDSITNNTAANCVLFLRQNKSDLIGECAKLNDSQMGEDCLRYHISFEDMDTRAIAACRVWNTH